MASWGYSVVGGTCYTYGVQLDTKYDFRSEIPPGRDADVWSVTLQRYHQMLWSKPLPSGDIFRLITHGYPGRYYLVYDSLSGPLELSSDAITTRLRPSPVAKNLPEAEQPPEPTYTVGRALLFPRVQRDRKQTINQRRGTHHAIRDRFDLTLECIRRHYAGQSSPLDDLLDRYADFFELFSTYRGYVDFFLLQDLVEPDYTVRFMHQFAEFATPALPATAEDYLRYISASNAFHAARNTRIIAWVAGES